MILHRYVHIYTYTYVHKHRHDVYIHITYIYIYIHISDVSGFGTLVDLPLGSTTTCSDFG